MEKLYLCDFPRVPVQGPAVPKTTKCDVEALKAYHPPRNDGAKEYIARLSPVGNGGLEIGSALPTSDTFKLEAIDGWPEESRALMESLTFVVAENQYREKCLRAEGTNLEVDGYVLTSWQIETVDLEDRVMYIDILNWRDSSGASFTTEWIWTHRP